jgi:hypothetical protein
VGVGNKRGARARFIGEVWDMRGLCGIVDEGSGLVGG